MPNTPITVQFLSRASSDTPPASPRISVDPMEPRPASAARVASAVLSHTASVDPESLDRALDGLFVLVGRVRTKLASAHCEGFSVDLGITAGGEVGLLGTGGKLDVEVAITLDFKFPAQQ